jgi:hypothetical protein
MTAVVAFAFFVTYVALRETWKASKPFVTDPRPCRV